MLTTLLKWTFWKSDFVRLIVTAFQWDTRAIFSHLWLTYRFEASIYQGLCCHMQLIRFSLFTFGGMTRQPFVWLLASRMSYIGFRIVLFNGALSLLNSSYFLFGAKKQDRFYSSYIKTYLEWARIEIRTRNMNSVRTLINVFITLILVYSCTILFIDVHSGVSISINALTYSVI